MTSSSDWLSRNSALRPTLRRELSNRELARAQLPFYSGGRGVLKVLAYLIEHGDYEELHETIKRYGRLSARIRSLRPRATGH